MRTTVHVPEEQAYEQPVVEIAFDLGPYVRAGQAGAVVEAIMAGASCKEIRLGLNRITAVVIDDEDRAALADRVHQAAWDAYDAFARPRRDVCPKGCGGAMVAGVSPGSRTPVLWVCDGCGTTVQNPAAKGEG